MGRNSPHPPLSAAIARLAEAQHGVVAQNQLVELGLTASAVRSWVERGRLHPMHRGVYAVGHPLLTSKGRALAAVLACGPGAVLSHRAAADLHGLRPSSAKKVEVTVRSRRRHAGIVIHRSRTLLERDVTEVDGIPCTSVARTLLDLAEVIDRDGLAKAIERAEILRVFDLSAIDDVLRRANGRRGAARLEKAIEAIRTKPPTRNDLEQAFFAICSAAGMRKPDASTSIEVDATTYEPDFAWHDLRLIAETDGFETHGTRTAFEADRLRDQRLARAGWHVIRFTWRQVMHEPAEVTRTLKTLTAASPTRARSAPRPRAARP